MEKSVALVLSSGGSWGLAHIGVISELEKSGYRISSVSGSSIGALVGGLYAMGKLDEYTEWINSFSKRDVWGYMDFTLTSHGLLKGERVFDKMKTFIPDINIENMSIPFAAIATDIINEKEIIFSSGSFYDAIRASIAIPAVFTPVKFKDTILVDGGVLSPVPIKHITRTTGDLLIVVNLYGGKNSSSREAEEENSSLNNLLKLLLRLTSTGDKKSPGYYSLLNKTSSAMIHKIAHLSMEKYKPDLVINIPCDSAKTFDFYKAKELIELGKGEARNAMRIYKNQCIIK